VYKPDIPEDLEDTVMRCLIKDPRERFPNVLDLLNELMLSYGKRGDAVLTNGVDPSTVVLEPDEVEKPDREKDEDEEETKAFPWMKLLPWVAVSTIACLAIVAFAVYKFLAPNPMEVTQTALAIQGTQTAQALALLPPSDTPIPPSPTLEPTDVPTETYTPSPLPTDTPTDTLTPSITPTETPTHTFTPIPTNTIKPSVTSCFVVITDWCLSHEGCATMEIRNKTGMNATVRFWKDDGSVDRTFISPPGRCTFQIRPGRYNYSFDYCGEHSQGAHALNDKWYITFQCP
jgi:hypothetical protein